MEAGIKAVYIEYKGGPEANAATMTGQITYWFASLAMALKPIQEGKLIALGVTSSKRNDRLPLVPTIAEAGIAGHEESNWWGIWAPAGIPAPVADKLAKDVARVLASPDLRAEFAKLGYESKSMTSAEFARFVRNEMESAARIAKKAGIKPQ